MRSKWKQRSRRPYQLRDQATDLLLYLRNIFLLIGLPVYLFSSDISWNYGITTNLGRGEQQGQDYDYSENYLSLSGQSGPWYLDLSLEYSSPPEYGYDFSGVQNLLLRYTSDSWVLEAGDISAVFGNGLALQLYEDQTIDFDNRIRGIRIQSEFLPSNAIKFIAGMNDSYRFYSPSSDLREPDGEASFRLIGLESSHVNGSGTWMVSPYLIGSQMVSDHSKFVLDTQSGSVNLDTSSQTQHAIQVGLGQTVSGSSWDVYLEFSSVWKAFDHPLIEQSVLQTGNGVTLRNEMIEYERQGQALNFQLNWFPEWATLMFDYRRYLSGPEINADKRDPLLLGQKALPWQMGPTGVRQHDINLLANVTHPVDYGDELGWTVEMRKYFGHSWNLILNASQVSRSRDNRDMSLDAGVFPSSDIRQHPWSEYFIELDYAGNRLSQRMLAASTRSVLSGVNSAEVSHHLTLVPAYMSWIINPDLVVTGVVELQKTRVTGISYDDIELDGHEFSSYHLVGSMDLQGKYSLSVIWDANDDPLLNAGKHEMQNWISGELSVKPLDGLWLRASYGKEKGGVRCTGGVCRILNPFEGFRVSMEWRR